MKKQLIVLFLALCLGIGASAQSKGVRIGYIDMEYILQNVSDYTDAKNILDQKAQKWKQEIEIKKNEITKLKESLNSEKVLLTKELLEEREEEISIKEAEVLEYQQKRFGPTGDLIAQKTVLVQPIQDQVFTAVQDIATAKRFDFVFDKSSDLTMIFADKRFDISDQVVRAITRASKKNQLTKKQLKEQEEKDKKEDEMDLNPALAERQKALEEKRKAREQLIADKKLAAEEHKKEIEDKRKQALADKEAKKNGSVTGTNSKEGKQSIEDKKAILDDLKAKKAKDLEDRRKALEEKRLKILADREAAKKAKENPIKENK